jgi:3-oxoacyl-[acyl-carrier-protein] synthase III
MGSVIAAVGAARGQGPGASSVALQVKAARSCLRRSAVSACDVGVLINAGVYRDRNVVEPAIATFIQHKIGANISLNGTPGTFSFDIDNGGCGLLTGCMLADGFLLSDAGRYGLVVAGDVEPVAGRSEAFAYDPAAAAVLLAPGPADAGFLAFQNDVDAAGLHSYSGHVEWEDDRYRLVMRQTDVYADECLAAALDGLATLLRETGLQQAEVDVLIPSQSPPRFTALLREATGLGERLVDVTAAYGNVHTAGPGLALERAWREGRLVPGARVVFLTVGAGIATALALYRVPG